MVWSVLPDPAVLFPQIHALRLLEIRQTDPAVAVSIHSLLSVCKLFAALPPFSLHFFIIKQQKYLVFQEFFTTQEGATK